MLKTSSILFWFILVMIASLGLYRTSNRVQELDQQLHSINAAIDNEKQSIHVLKAEWVYLANPARIEIAAHRHLALRPTAPQQVATIDTLSEVLPTRSEAMSTVAVNASPIANIRTTLAARMESAHDVTISHGSKAKPVAVAANESKAKESAHLRDHMIMVQRTASASPMPGDKIGTMLTELSSR